MPEISDSTSARTAQAACANPCAAPELLQTLRAALPQFFDCEGVFLRDTFDAALRTAGISESSNGPDASGKKQKQHQHSAGHAVQPNGANDASGSRMPPGLTKRQREILGLLRLGHSQKDMAYELGVSHGAVRAMVCLLRKRLGPLRVPLLRRIK